MRCFTFLVSEYAASYDRNEKFKPPTSYQAMKQGFIDLRKAHGATNHDVNWACFKALQCNDGLSLPKTPSPHDPTTDPDENYSIIG